MAVVPLAYAAGQRPAYNLTLMPGLVKNHDHAARLVKSPFMQELEKIMAKDDVMVLVHGYLAGGFAGKDKCITKPEDIAGLQTRAAGKAFEQMLAGGPARLHIPAAQRIVLVHHRLELLSIEGDVRIVDVEPVPPTHAAVKEAAE